MLAGATVATALVIGPTTSAPRVAHSLAASLAMGGAVDRAGSSPGIATTSSLELRRYRAQAQAAERAAAARQAPARQTSAGGHQVSAASSSPQQIARAMLADFGWSSSQFSCLQPLWARESGWNPYASNPSSGAYGIPQALPGSKMASAGADWATDAATQIRWGLGYIKATYGSPCAAWGHESAAGWY